MKKSAPRPTEEQTARALAYLKGEMDDSERASFEEALTESEELREELARSRALLDSLKSAGEDATVQTVNRQIVEGIACGASDIHVVPQRTEMIVSYRVDGYLQEASRSPRAMQDQSLIDRWKVMADMDIAERRLPQDGRIPLRHQEKNYDLRVNILPTLYGERVTARILSQSDTLLGLERMNISAAPLAALGRLARLSAGMILTSGNTGSGKTTLLYSLLMEIQKAGRAGRNLMTVEDPIEYQIGGVSQTAVNKRAGLTFAAALRSFLRCDPDVILCGEMRDLETAEIAVETALTGHLILSALHTKSALGCVQRLRDMGLETFLIADVLGGVAAQRLVRRIDARRTEEYEPAEEELAQAGLTRADGPFRRGVPTEANGMTGFQGRVPLVEVVEITPTLRRLIAEKAPYEDLWRAAFAKSRDSLRDDARARVKAGLTTVEEVNWALYDYPMP